MTALSKFGPALHVALSAVSFITVALPIRSLSPPHSHPNPVICRLLVILVATCIGVSGLMRLASDNNSTIFASRVVELVGQSTGAFFHPFLSFLCILRLHGLYALMHTCHLLRVSSNFHDYAALLRVLFILEST